VCLFVCLFVYAIVDVCMCVCVQKFSKIVQKLRECSFSLCACMRVRARVHTCALTCVRGYVCSLQTRGSSSLLILAMCERKRVRGDNMCVSACACGLALALTHTIDLLW